MKVGDRVVCIKSHSTSHKNGIVKGKIFPIMGTNKCSCGLLAFDVGAISSFHDPMFSGFIKCSCGKRERSGLVWWISSRLFAPIQTKSEFISSDEFTTIEETIDCPVPKEIETN